MLIVVKYTINSHPYIFRISLVHLYFIRPTASWNINALEKFKIYGCSYYGIFNSKSCTILLILIYDYDTKMSENSLCLGEHWLLLWRVWKWGCARICCPFRVSEKPGREVPPHRNFRWRDEFMINYDGYWLYCVYDMVYLCKKCTE